MFYNLNCQREKFIVFVWYPKKFESLIISFNIFGDIYSKGISQNEDQLIELIELIENRNSEFILATYSVLDIW